MLLHWHMLTFAHACTINLDFMWCIVYGNPGSVVRHCMLERSTDDHNPLCLYMIYIYIVNSIVMYCICARTLQRLQVLSVWTTLSLSLSLSLSLPLWLAQTSQGFRSSGRHPSNTFKLLGTFLWRCWIISHRVPCSEESNFRVDARNE